MDVSVDFVCKGLVCFRGKSDYPKPQENHDCVGGPVVASWENRPCTSFDFFIILHLNFHATRFVHFNNP